MHNISEDILLEESSKNEDVAAPADEPASSSLALRGIIQGLCISTGLPYQDCLRLSPVR